MGFLGKLLALFAGFLAAVAGLLVECFTDVGRVKESKHFYMDVNEKGDIDLKMIAYDGSVIQGMIPNVDVPKFVENAINVGVHAVNPDGKKQKDTEIDMQYT